MFRVILIFLKEVLDEVDCGISSRQLFDVGYQPADEVRCRLILSLPNQKQSIVGQEGGDIHSELSGRALIPKLEVPLYRYV